MARDDHILLGTIAKTHGVRGELIIRTASPSFDLKEERELIFLRIDGILVPFFISSLRQLKPGEWVVKLDWYENKNQADSLVGYQVWADAGKTVSPDDELYMDEMVGFQVLDVATGVKGTIREFMDIPENPVFVVEMNRDQVLIPARDEFILEVDTAAKLVKFELPEGLI